MHIKNVHFMKMTKPKPLIIIFSLCCLLLAISLFHKSILIKTARYLSVSRPVDGEVLIIEGWINSNALIEAVEVFKNSDYKYLLITANHENFSAIETIKNAGLEERLIRMAERGDNSTGHNTFDMANAAKIWLSNNDPSIKNVDVFTASVHGRKSWVVFSRVFGKEYEVGIKSSNCFRRDPQRWGRSRAGKKRIAKNLLGYFYAMLWPFGLYT